MFIENVKCSSSVYNFKVEARNLFSVLRVIWCLSLVFLMENLPEGNRVNKFSALKLIKLIKARPIIWDSSRPDFRAYSHKENEWREIYEALDDKYRSSDEKTQAEIGAKITAKWRNIRDAFARSFKKRAVHTKVKKYMYHDELSFMLRPSNTDESLKRRRLGRRRQLSSNSESVSENFTEGNTSYYGIMEDPLITDFKVEPENQAASVEAIFNVEIVDDEKLTNCSEKHTNLKRKTRNSNSEIKNSDSKLPRVEMEIENQPIKQEDQSESLNLSEISKTVAKEETKIDGTAPPDEDQSFFASILSLVRDMSDDEKLEFRMAVLKQIQETRLKRCG